MAEDSDNEDRTFDASPRRREEARRQGRYAFSQDLGSSALLLGGVTGLMMLGPWMGSHLLEFFREDLSKFLYLDLDSATAQQILIRIYIRGLYVAGGLLAILLLTAIVVGIIQAGFHLSAEKLAPDFEKLNPASGMQKLFSMGSVVKGLLATVKVILLAWIAYTILKGRAGILLSLGHDSLEGASISAWKLLMRVSIVMSTAIAIVGLVDWIYQYRRFEASLRMTREEFEREQKEDDGDPRLKQRRRQIARERVKRKMLASVPKSTVVVTNPTHYSVALRYEQGIDQAPIVIAKGSGGFARKIANLAREHNVPVLERPELARLLFRTVKEEQAVPPGLFLAVAEVIAFVYRLRGLAKR